ncbi:hypothetical protein [Elizabethkingia phage TCUEAP1]|nr:hypothetical protein [Elizabethkingia phage TCUEAP1]
MIIKIFLLALSLLALDIMHYDMRRKPKVPITPKYAFAHLLLYYMVIAGTIYNLAKFYLTYLK